MRPRFAFALGLSALVAWQPSDAAQTCLGLVTASGECVYKLETPGQTAMEHEAPREPDRWRRCLAAGEVSDDCPEFIFHRASFRHTEDEIAKQKMSIIVWQAARAAFRCEDETFNRFQQLVASNFSGVDTADLARTLPALGEMQAYIEETC